MFNDSISSEISVQLSVSRVIALLKASPPSEYRYGYLFTILYVRMQFFNHFICCFGYNHIDIIIMMLRFRRYCNITRRKKNCSNEKQAFNFFHMLISFNTLLHKNPKNHETQRPLLFFEFEILPFVGSVTSKSTGQRNRQCPKIKNYPCGDVSRPRCFFQFCF